MSEDYDDDSMEVDLGQSKKEKMLLVYFLKKVLKGLPLPVRVLFVRRFKKRYQDKKLRCRMLDIVKKMRGTMRKNIQGAGFRDKLKMMINKIRERITKHYAASRSLMAAKKLKKKTPKVKKVKKKIEPSAEKEDKPDGSFEGKYPLTKFYGNNPVVVYYVPIIADSADSELSKLPKNLPGSSTLKQTI